jgi:hypothetical protein
MDTRGGWTQVFGAEEPKQILEYLETETEISSAAG